jgi:hypothetical protein
MSVENELILVGAIVVGGVILLSGPGIIQDVKGSVEKAVNAISNLGCPGDKEQQGLLCYDRCKEGYTGILTTCWSDCGSDFLSNGGTDDGAFCRKGSYNRGVGRPIHSCDTVKIDGEDTEPLAGLCRKRCRNGYKRSGLSCMEECKSDETDDGLTCRIDSKIISSDNTQCPWYDKCGLVSARGCSKCPDGYINDGCTCRRDVKVRGKDIYTDIGQPFQCSSNEEYQAGLCYDKCKRGYKGQSIICWQDCPNNSTDIGISCQKDSYYRGIGDAMIPQ